MSLSRDFYLQDAVKVAQNLVGKKLIRNVDGEKLVGKIVETEAYMGRSDKASHTYKGKSDRTNILFSEGGKVYVYLIYGMHNCLNITVNKESLPQAVLIRALEPIQGKHKMHNFRDKKGPDLTNGPAKLCQAFNIDRSLYGEDIIKGNKLLIKNGDPSDKLVSTTRINIDYAEEDKDNPWRFYEANNQYISQE